MLAHGSVYAGAWVGNSGSPALWVLVPACVDLMLRSSILSSLCWFPMASEVCAATLFLWWNFQVL